MAAADAPRTAQHTAMGPGIFHVVEAVLLSLPTTPPHSQRQKSEKSKNNKLKNTKNQRKKDKS